MVDGQFYEDLCVPPADLGVGDHGQLPRHGCSTHGVPKIRSREDPPPGQGNLIVPSLRP